jgi:hypothetical protein
MASSAMSMPSDSSRIPNVQRGTEDWGSSPTIARHMPAVMEISALIRDPLTNDAVSTSAPVSSTVYSAAPKLTATSTSTGARSTRPNTATIPPM